MTRGRTRKCTFFMSCSLLTCYFLAVACQPPSSSNSVRRGSHKEESAANPTGNDILVAKQTTKQKQQSCLFITNGIKKEPSSYPSVVFIKKDKGNGLWEPCTGTFVGDNAVITAAHCLDDNQANGGPAHDLTVYIGGSRGQQLPVISAFYPKWVGDEKSVYGDDLAVLLLKEGSATAITPVARTPVAIGDVDIITGYGALQIGAATNETNPEFNLYQGTNNVYSLIDDHIFQVGESGTDIRSQLGQNALAAPGDSGGPLFINNFLAGTESWGTGTILPEFFDDYRGKISSSPTPNTYQTDAKAAIGMLPHLDRLKERVVNGEKIGIETHVNLTLPKFQNWLKTLETQGVHIQFAPIQTPGSCGV